MSYVEKILRQLVCMFIFTFNFLFLTIFSNASDDIERAAKKLKSLGSGFEVLTVGSRKMIQSVPCELNIDHTTVLVLAQKNSWVNPSLLKKELNWTRERIDSVLVISFL